VTSCSVSIADRRGVAAGGFDAWWSVGLFVFAMAVGVAYCIAFERSHPPPEPWVRELGAAAAFACGRGFVDPGYAPSPAFAAFLEKKIDRISCEALPAGIELRPPNFTQSLYRYLTLAVALVWALLGISWTAVAGLAGALYGMTAALVYGLFRLAAPRTPALAGAAIMTMSPLQLRYLPQLRDYAKAPFLLALILILGLLVVRPFTRRRLLALSACYGAVAGIGFGFRNDLLIAAPPFLVTVFAFVPAPARAHFRFRLGAVAACALVFIICAWPIVTAYRSGSNSGHVAVLGLMTYFDRPLGVNRSVYNFGAPYDDGFAIKVISSFAERVHGRALVPLSPDHDRAAVEFLLLIARHWPADLLLRAYASTLRIVELPFQIRLYTTAAPPGVDNGIVRALFAIWVDVLSRFSRAGAILTAVAILAAAGSSLRLAAWLLLTLLYFGGYPALQFDARHFFFLELVPWLALASLAGVALNALSGAGPASLRAGGLVGRRRRVLWFALVSTVAIAGSLMALRVYQQRQVTALIDRYLEAPADPLTLVPNIEGDGHVLLRPAGLSQAVEPRIRAEYLVADVARRHCPTPGVALTVRYVTRAGYTDLTQRVQIAVPRSDDPFRLFFPAYYSSGGYFAGLEVAEADRGCIAMLRRVVAIDRPPILLTLALPPEWRELKLYQTLALGRRPFASGD
jgi:hypothetical protein